jgi:hypothetical protein
MPSQSSVAYQPTQSPANSSPICVGPAGLAKYVQVYVLVARTEVLELHPRLSVSCTGSAMSSRLSHELYA